ncbi:putative membrane protein [Bradyrhizobium sp. USDA 4011]
MFERLPVLFHSAMYALRGGFLIRPLAIAMILGAVGAVLSSLEEAIPGIGAWIPSTLFPSHDDPGVAQVILSSIATSIMTVVSIVFAILLMTLTLASTQFSPRILISFVRDRTTQGTLGVFLGTFGYCMAALPAARSLPHPFVPVATVTGAMVLALVCVGWLIYFINHISRSISVNHIVDRIAHETELVIDEFMIYPRGPFELPDRSEAPAAEHGTPIFSRKSGYIRYIDINRLVALAKGYQICVHLERRVGQFVPAGVPLMRVSKPERVPAGRALHLIAAFDIGPARTMQQDVEFGIIQIVDIALRAISPAINDPSTAISCVDQLSRIMILWISRLPPPSHYYAPPHVLRLFVPWITFDGLLDTAFEQIRHYAVADVAVSLRLLRAFDDIASTTQHADMRTRLLERARRVTAGCAGHLPTDELARLQHRLATLEIAIAARTEG